MANELGVGQAYEKVMERFFPNIPKEQYVLSPKAHKEIFKTLLADAGVRYHASKLGYLRTFVRSGHAHSLVQPIDIMCLLALGEDEVRQPKTGLYGKAGATGNSHVLWISASTLEDVFRQIELGLVARSKTAQLPESLGGPARERKPKNNALSPADKKRQSYKVVFCQSLGIDPAKTPASFEQFTSSLLSYLGLMEGRIPDVRELKLDGIDIPIRIKEENDLATRRSVSEHFLLLTDSHAARARVVDFEEMLRFFGSVLVKNCPDKVAEFAKDILPQIAPEGRGPG